MNDLHIRLLCIIVNGIFLIGVCTSSQAQSLKPGRLTGIIRDESNQPVAGASITVENQGKGTGTSVSGDYVLVLAPGTYIVLVSAINFSSQRLSDVVIRPDEQTDLSITLTRSKKDTLGGVVVTANARRATVAGLLQLQKNAADMRDGISQEQMVRLSATNIAQVLTRVSGVNVQSGKFVTVRGVSDRYNNVLINGSSLPSTEPNRRNFSFDIIPSALVDNVIVNKTATPDLPGEFTGGLVQVNTKDVPVKNFLEISIGAGINSESFDRVYSGFKRDKNAGIGKIDKERSWYGDGRLLDPVKYFLDFSRDDTIAARKVAGRIPSRWQRYRYSYTPAQNYQLSGGLNKRFAKGNSFGVVAAATYQNEQLYEEGDSRSLSVFEGKNTRTRYTTVLGGLVNATYKTAKHKVSWKNLYNKRYTLQSDDAEVQNINIGQLQQRISDVVFSGALFQSRLEAEHLLTNKSIKADWYVDYINYEREQPDSRYLAGVIDTLTGITKYNFSDPPLVWGGLYSATYTENRNNAGLNLSFPFIIKEEKQLIKIGYAYSKRDVDYDGASFRIRNGRSNIYFTPGQIGLPYYEIATQENLLNGNLELLPTGVKAGSIGDKYNGTQKLNALYAMADIRFLKKLRLIGGVRNENNKMYVNTFTTTKLDAPPWLDRKDTTSLYTDNDLLPSVNLIYSINNKMNLRTAFSKTVARPDFFERIALVRYFDFAEQLEIFGDEALEISRIKNYDLRFEFYPSPGEIVSASLFYKDFDKPVERFLIPGNPTNTVQYKNLYKAKALGFEVDVRKSLEFLNPSSSFFKNLVVSGNFSYLSGELSYVVTRRADTSSVDDTFYVASQKRPIQNLAPYIINLGLAYQKDNWGLNLSFNRTGRKIVNGGVNTFYVQYEEPRNILDFQAYSKFYKQKMELRFNISDMLNDPFIIYSNTDNGINSGGIASAGPNNDSRGDAYNEKLDFIGYKVRKGMGFSIKAIYKF